MKKCFRQNMRQKKLWKHWIHDFRMVNGEKQINLIFDFVIPREYSEEKGNELTLTLMDRLQHHNPKYQCVITLDRSYVEEQR